MGVNDDAYSGIFEQLDSEKQQRFDARVARELLKAWGVSTTSAAQYEHQAVAEASPRGGFTPQWLSDVLGSPIVFAAARDYWIKRDDDKGVPAPEWLFTHRIDSPRCRRVWNDLWLETKDMYGDDRYIAVCFRPPWAERILALHNYEPVLQHWDPPLEGAAMLWRVQGQLVLLQHLPDLLKVLATKWMPKFAW